jgi:hypothetical protein
MKQIIYITLHMDMSRYRILLRCLTPAMPDAFWSTVGGGSSHRSFDDWWTTLPDEFKKIPYKIDDPEKPTLQDVENIISQLHSQNKEKFKPAESEIQHWLTNSQIQKNK